MSTVVGGAMLPTRPVIHHAATPEDKAVVPMCARSRQTRKQAARAQADRGSVLQRPCRRLPHRRSEFTVHVGGRSSKRIQ